MINKVFIKILKIICIKTIVRKKSLVWSRAKGIRLCYRQNEDERASIFFAKVFIDFQITGTKFA